MRVHNLKKQPISTIVDPTRCEVIRADFSADYVPTHKQRIDLSNAENPAGNSANVTKIIKNASSMITHYPERGHGAFIRVLSEHHKIPTDAFFVGNGATGCIQNVVAAFVGNNSNVLLPELSFPLPIFAATVMGGEARKVSVKKSFRIDFQALLQSINSKTKLVFICNPNNPTGLYESPKSILAFARKTSVPVLVSEANIEYVGSSLLDSFLSWPDNLIVIRSFSKVHGLAGLRVGYGVAQSKIIKEVAKCQLPFAVSGLAQVAAAAALSDKKHVKRSTLLVKKESQFICDNLEKLGFKVLPITSNILLARLPQNIIDDKFFISELEKQEITVLNGAAFSPLLKGWIRISPRTRKTNISFLAGIKKVLRK